MDNLFDETQKYMNDKINYTVDSDDGLPMEMQVINESEEVCSECSSDSGNSSTVGSTSISFCGSGFMGFYHLGVVTCFQQYTPQINDLIICGSSSGSLAAMALCLDLPLETSIKQMMEVITKARDCTLGLFDPDLNVNQILYEKLVENLPEDCHLRASGRLNLSMTRVSDGKNVVINRFDSKEDLILAIQCSCFIPFASGVVPLRLYGTAYIDGAFSNNFPIIDHNTITVSPYSGESDICPNDNDTYPFHFNFYDNHISLSTSNLSRMKRMCVAGHPDYYLNLCQQGFDDALRYLLRNNMIRCIQCLRRPLILNSRYKENSVKENKELEFGCDVGDVYHSAINCANCIDCHYRRQIAVYDTIPDSVIHEIQSSYRTMDECIIISLLWNRPKKLLSILTAPYFLPINLTKKMFTNILAMRTEPKNSLYSAMIFMRSLMTFGNNLNIPKKATKKVTKVNNQNNIKQGQSLRQYMNVSINSDLY